MNRTKNGAATPAADLPDRIVELMANAPYAPLVVRCASDRATFLPEIASLHTRRELSQIDGLGRASIARIEAWLAQYGRKLRKPGESLDSVICHFGTRRDRLRQYQRRKPSADSRHVIPG